MADDYLKFIHSTSWKDIQKITSVKELLTVGLGLLVTALLIYQKVFRKKYRLPPGPTGLPILGYIPFLGREPYKELDKLKKVYGNVFSVYLGRTFVVILGDFEAMKDVFSKSTTLDRPVRLLDFIPDGMGISNANGSEWTEQRRFCVKSMKDLGVGKDKWEQMIQEEVEDIIKTVASFNSQPTEIDEIIVSSISNNISYFVFGRRLPVNDPERKSLDKAVDDAMNSFNQASFGTFFPVIRDVQKMLGIGTYAKFFKNLKKLNDFFRKEVGKLRGVYEDGEHENFIVDYLREMDKNKSGSGHYFNETNLYGNIQALFIGGSDTARTSLHWLFLAMAKFLDIQAKVHDEVDSVLGKDNRIRWADRRKVPYTFATIMEGQRWMTVVPLNSARITTEDIKIQNYDVPKGTTVIANNWGLHNDPKYWKDPQKFKPERFLTDDNEVILKPDSYNPFSYGKRSCPGETIAMMELLLYFTALMQNFTVMAPVGKKVVIEGTLGLSFQAVRQDLVFVPREGRSPTSEA